MVTAARAAFHHGSVAYFLARLAATSATIKQPTGYTPTPSVRPTKASTAASSIVCVAAIRSTSFISRVNPTGSFTAERSCGR